MSQGNNQIIMNKDLRKTGRKGTWAREMIEMMEEEREMSKKINKDARKSVQGRV